MGNGRKVGAVSIFSPSENDELLDFNHITSL